jgi:sulfite exporter TauE/SafE
LNSAAIILVNGLALGLASTLHCAGMCGAISSSLALCQPTRRSFGSGFALSHAGRIAAYMIAGGVVGAAGAPAIGWLDRELAYRLLQWAGAVAVMWVGLSIAGLMPSFARLDRYMLALSGGVTRFSMGTGFGAGPSGPLVAGLAWGLMPCGMVYGALFTAMLTGSATGGMLAMMAFGLGTLPGLFATTFGMKSLRDFATRGIGRVAAGLTIALLGFVSVFIASPSGGLLCFRTASNQAITTSSPTTIPGSAALPAARHQ